jgi:hypothetical protein
VITKKQQKKEDDNARNFGQANSPDVQKADGRGSRTRWATAAARCVRGRAAERGRWCRGPDQERGIWKDAEGNNMSTIFKILEDRKKITEEEKKRRKSKPLTVSSTPNPSHKGQKMAQIRHQNS